jgi:hypothetical protein
MRHLWLLAGLTVLSACAEHNFVPGSPLARMNGYNRTYEQIAADDCAKQGFIPGTEPHRYCVAELAAGRRWNDANYQRGMSTMGAAGAAIYAAGQPVYPQPVQPAVQTYVVGNQTVTCTTAGTLTNCY